MIGAIFFKWVVSMSLLFLRKRVQIIGAEAEEWIVRCVCVWVQPIRTMRVKVSLADLVTDFHNV